MSGSGRFDARNDPKFEALAICPSCIHFRGLTCTAFPDGIPLEIVVGKVVHTTPYQGDHGIQYSAKGV